MSTHKVEIIEINEILSHDNADNLEIAVIGAWHCIIGLGQFVNGDKAIYIPIDSILPEDLEEKIFGNAKIVLKNSRIRTIKIRGYISQGLIISLDMAGISNNLPVGTDVAEILKITKYEPKSVPACMNTGKTGTNRNPNTNFKKYTSIENYKNYNTVFTSEDDVIVSEKIHGTNFRCGYVEKVKLSFFDKVKKFFGFSIDEHEFVFGSHNVQLQETNYKGFYTGNVYADIAEKYDLKNLIPRDVVVYGEIYGCGIQKNYDYGLLKDDLRLAVFDVMIKDEYVSYGSMKDFCKAREIPTVKTIYRGKFDIDVIKAICSGDSKMYPEQKAIEGGIIKPADEERCRIGRKVLKLINDEYLLNKTNTDYH